MPAKTQALQGFNTARADQIYGNGYTTLNSTRGTGARSPEHEEVKGWNQLRPLVARSTRWLAAQDCAHDQLAGPPTCKPKPLGIGGACRRELSRSSWLVLIASVSVTPPFDIILRLIDDRSCRRSDLGLGCLAAVSEFREHVTDHPSQCRYASNYS